MNHTEATLILDERLSAFARQSYSELSQRVERTDSTTVTAPSGTEYQLEFNVFYDDDAAREDLRIVGSIDDGGWRAIIPLTKTLLLSPNGKLR